MMYAVVPICSVDQAVRVTTYTRRDKVVTLFGETLVVEQVSCTLGMHFERLARMFEAPRSPLEAD